MNKSLTTQVFIERAKKIHGDKYDYSKVSYINCKEKVCIICPKHGEFWQRPDKHLRSQGCPKCTIEKSTVLRRKTKDEFVKQAKEVHGDKYGYSKVNYVNNRTKVCIICPEHGEFWQEPQSHLAGHKCPICGKEEMAKAKSDSLEDFIEKAKKIHGNKYDYSKVSYKNAATKVCIKCNKCGNEFWQRPNEHLKPKGCPYCVGLYRTTKEFIKMAKEIHGDKYDYSKVEYKNATSNICIICTEHGEFWQSPHNHLKGKGCPKCQRSKLEEKIENFLNENKIEYIYQYRKQWLGLQSLDFYLPEYKIGIECQGKQHFKPIKYFGGKEKFIYQQKMDEKKLKKCQDNNIQLLYFSDIEYNKKIITDTETLLKEIKKGEN